MSRPDLEELAQRRAEAQRFLVRNPDDVNAPMIRVFLAATAPPTQTEAIPVMILNANVIGGWDPKESDTNEAADALSRGDQLNSWQKSIRAQWATLVHFCGGVP